MRINPPAFASPKLRINVKLKKFNIPIGKTTSLPNSNVNAIIGCQNNPPNRRPNAKNIILLTFITIIIMEFVTKYAKQHI